MQRRSTEQQANRHDFPHRHRRPFFDHLGLDRRASIGIVGDALSRADDGELFLEYRQSESLVLDDGRSEERQLRYLAGLRPARGRGRGHRARARIRPRRGGDPQRRRYRTRRLPGLRRHLRQPAPRTNRALYDSFNPLALVPFETKTRLLADIDAYARGKDERVRQVIASLWASGRRSRSAPAATW